MTMRRALILGLGILVVCGCDVEPATLPPVPSVEDLPDSTSQAETELRSFVWLFIDDFRGRPADCGQHKLDWAGAPWVPIPAETLQASLECGLAAVGQGQPFTTSAELQSIDSWVVQGLLGRPGRGVFRFSFDSQPGGRGSPGRFTIEFCATPTVLTPENQRRPLYVCRE
jgi:hypothetical protein